MATKDEKSKLIGELVTGLFMFLTDWAFLKLGWDLVLVKVFPILPIISWPQAYVLWLICGILFKQRNVTIVKDYTK